EDMLELVATEGLRAEAVATTRLRFDEGLVGHIAESARPLAIQDAPRHPSFSYRPETGEDPYHAFLGVPVLRAGRVVGVLTLQNRTEREYGDEEVESLQTIAMVLAEIIAGELADEESSLPRLGLKRQNAESFSGRILCGGLSVAEVVLHDPVVPPAKFFAADSEAEQKRLAEGLSALREQVDRMLSSEGSGGLWGDPRDVMETYRMLANDPSWAERLLDGVRSGLSAEASIDRARREHRARMEAAKDPYLRERLHDLEDLDNRLLRVLAGIDDASAASALQGKILVARRLGPAELLEYRNFGLAGIILEEVGASSHAAIVARALGLPTLGDVDGVTTSLENGDMAIIDAEDGVVHVRPDEHLQAAYAERAAVIGQRNKRYRALRDKIAETQDGKRVSLFLNAGLGLDMDTVAESGADGVGLFRTEFQFLVSEKIPSLGEQVSFYRRVLEAAGDRPVYFRTLDLGGDKMLPSLNAAREENPALGWRSIRFALDKRGLFRRQLRALVRASEGRPLRVMFPMVTVASEFLAAKGL
ncbi:MAG: putative PEP-binding protein, partial [Pseudomonadota bacterium]